ncbi:MAG: hypothetical protein H6862_06715 [Rhodospirillales bacterium]|nr:hypothetical protein [Rhodospirillales bacterium]
MPLIRFFIFTLFAGFFALAPLRGAVAESKPCWFAWWPSHWTKMDWEKRHFEDGKTPINTQWNDVSWLPQDWIAQSNGDGMSMIQRFYDAGILSDQYLDDETPVLEVGPGFYRLGGYDKRRVIAAVDAVYHATSRAARKAIRIEDSRTGKPLGFYTASGLVLQ